VERLALGDVDHADRADRGIDREPADRFCRLARLELQQEVQEDDRLAQIIEEIVDAAPDRARHGLLVGSRDRADHRVVDLLRHCERLGIDRAQRIACGFLASGDDDVAVGIRRVQRCRTDRRDRLGRNPLRLERHRRKRRDQRQG